MKASDVANMDLLKSIGRRAVRELGLSPEFSPATLNQTDVITSPAASGLRIPGTRQDHEIQSVAETKHREVAFPT